MALVPLTAAETKAVVWVPNVDSHYDGDHINGIERLAADVRTVHRPRVGDPHKCLTAVWRPIPAKSYFIAPNGIISVTTANGRVIIAKDFVVEDDTNYKPLPNVQAK